MVSVAAVLRWRSSWDGWGDAGAAKKGAERLTEGDPAPKADSCLSPKCSILNAFRFNEMRGNY